MSYSTTMALLMYHIRSELYKTTDTSIIDILAGSSVSSSYTTSDLITQALSRFEKGKINFDELKRYILNIPIKFAKKVIELTRDPDMKELIEAYMLYYEFYNLNTLLRAKLSGHTEKDLFLFNYSTTTTIEELMNAERIEDIKNHYIKTLLHHKLKNRNLYDAIKTVSISTINELLFLSSVEYYQNLISKKVKFGYNYERIVKIKSFYDILMMLAKMKFISGIDVEKYIQNLYFLEDKQNVLAEIFLSTKESFIKKCIDTGILPPNFILTDIDDIDKFKNILLKNKCKDIIIGTPMDPATVIAIIVMREIDMKNYFAIIGGFESGFKLEEIRQDLVL
ncbi:MAG: V-type ATPase subunit [Spirochaetia bacterium]|nr:V-type ATPase subunit [Spirochaetota bacterium]MDW8112597.1 V-type ATPase subunit [Spirochaetia bacterium]